MARTAGQTRKARTRPLGARDAAHETLTRAAARFPDLLPLRIEGDLAPRDRALASSIVRAVATRWATLEHVCNRYSRRPMHSLDGPVRAALLAGAAQLLLLDGIAVHAALNETVELIKRGPARKASGVVNAVLRRVSELAGPHEPDQWNGEPDTLPLADGGVRKLGTPVLPDDPWRALAIATSVPKGLLSGWRALHGDEHARRLALHTIAPAPIVLNARHAPDDALAQLPDGATRPHADHGLHVWLESVAALRETLERTPGVWVQDPASVSSLEFASEHINPDDVSLAIDLCAGAGTKTRQMRGLLPDANLIAADTDSQRRDDARRVFEADDRVRVMHADEAATEVVGKADLVLADVPCSNTGVLARRPEARYRAGPRQAERLIEVQRAILARCRGMLRPGGVLVYATCSLERDENEAQTAWAAAHLGITPLGERTRLPTGGPGQPPAEHRDGSYAAVMRAV